MLEHGGRLQAAARHYGRAPAQWLDLSTGLNPAPWPIPPALAAQALQACARLPEDDDDLRAAARAYYGAELLPVAGSQAAIQCLPTLRARSRVAVLTPGYAEPAHCWRRAGHVVEPLAAAALPSANHDVVIVAQPNNPDGRRFERDALLRLHARLHARGGWLIVDEAFIDATPQDSLVDAASTRDGLIVLRSFGKFFGLAGARVGFVAAAPALRAALADALGPWPIAGPSRVIARAALRDRRWQRAARVQLHAQSQGLAARLHAQIGAVTRGCALFQWWTTPQAAALHDALAQHGVLTRLYRGDTAVPMPSLRIGLPPADAWPRFDSALAAATQAVRSERAA
ncbi:threonine-phosphate decarboxylase CobD [Solimonas marina]|uniref:threonine-phosphate decarboxylase n=1 Tax=Solimonas marina TaxID=2714601 RepID=A0A970B395_9GAMM|nr:threonine-phosphate decarboxylase CobD [Solimonas marina]NKF21007.1 threonine-phosphate decarboxylase [Solimonas marina]